MKSQTAPVSHTHDICYRAPLPLISNSLTPSSQINETHIKETNMPPRVKDNAFVSVYNDSDISEYLFTTPAFASGFLPLEPEDTTHPHQHIAFRAKVRPAATSNTGTTPPPLAMEKKTVISRLIKSAIKATPAPNTAAKVVERRPSFIEVTTPAAKKMNTSIPSPPRSHRRHSSESHIAMKWWPENEETVQHKWVTGDGTSADEEEDFIEEEVWGEAFYE